MIKLITLLIIMAPFKIFCQDLTGTWEGSGGGTTYIKMVVIHRKDSLFGYTYDEGDGFCKATFMGRYSRQKKRLVGKGITMIKRTPNHVLVDYDLIYSKEPGGEYLRENIGEAGFFQRLFGSSSRQYLKRTSKKTDLVKRTVPKPVPENIPPVVKQPERGVPVTPSIVRKEKPVTKSIVKEPVIKPPTPGTKIQRPLSVRDTVAKITPVTKQPSITPLALIKKKDERISRLVQTIYTSSDTVKMYVYDNGEVDGDTVTVFFDNTVILNRYRISEKAKELSLPVSRNGQEHVIELFANNLGTIPPNTALIILMAGKKRYELRASYDLSSNAKIIIQFRE